MKTFKQFIKEAVKVTRDIGDYKVSDGKNSVTLSRVGSKWMASANWTHWESDPVKSKKDAVVSAKNMLERA